jgi:hypothetical protein
MRKQTEQRALNISTNRRGDERMQVEWPGVLTLEDDTSVACTVRDVSLAGVQVESEARLAVGNEIVLHVPSIGTFAGTVRWLGGRNVGLSLEAGPDLLLKRIAEDRDNYPGLQPKTGD